MTDEAAGGHPDDPIQCNWINWPIVSVFLVVDDKPEWENTPVGRQNEKKDPIRRGKRSGER